MPADMTATVEGCIRRVLDRIEEEREDGSELALEEVEVRLRHALSLPDGKDLTDGS